MSPTDLDTVARISEELAPETVYLAYYVEREQGVVRTRVARTRPEAFRKLYETMQDLTWIKGRYTPDVHVQALLDKGEYEQAAETVAQRFSDYVDWEMDTI